MSTPLISVSVPVYNIAPYIDSCIRSIVSQTYRNLDIMLMVQPSDDGSADICHNWYSHDTRIRVIELPFADLANARNEGVNKAYGDIICFVDGDDLIHKEHIERLYTVMEETGADIVQGKVYAFHNENALPEEIPGTGDVEIMSGREFELRRQKGIYGSFSAVTQTKLYKKSIFRGISFPVGRINEDVAMGFKLYEESEKIAVLDLETYYYRSNREGSITHDDSKLLRLACDGYLAKKDMWEYFRGYDPELTSFAAYYLCNHIVRTKNEIPADEFKNNDTLLEMKKLHSVYLRDVDVRYSGAKRKGLAVLGRFLPKLWYRLNEDRTKRARAIEWKDKE